MSQRRVVVTGMGMISPLGNDMASSWDGIINGRSGLGPITSFDVSQFTTRIAGEIRNFDPTAFMTAKDVKKMDAFIHYGIAASLMAMDDLARSDRSQCGTHRRADRCRHRRHPRHRGADSQGLEGGPRKISPFYIPSTIINMLPGQLSIMKGIKGAEFLRGIGLRHVQPFHRHGHAHDPVRRCRRDGRWWRRARFLADLVGGLPMKAMSTRNDDPAAASRPRQGP